MTHLNLETLEELPDRLAIFPLPGVLLLPEGHLPLNIFEPRYLAMVNDSFQNGRLIGMIQTKPTIGSAPDIYAMGCAGRITCLEETPDGRYLISLKGLCRFHVVREISVSTPYRQVVPSWNAFAADLHPPAPPPGFDRAAFLMTLKSYFDRMGMTCEKWNDLDAIAPHNLLSTLSMVCPFSAEEKQALLEAPDCKRRYELLLAMMEMAGKAGPSCRH